MRLADIQTLDDDALGAALADALNSLPSAEPARLARIRDQLPLAARKPTRNRWAQIVTIGVLTGSGLAAAWWAYEKLLVAEAPVAQSQPAVQQQPAPVIKHDSTQTEEQQDGLVKKGDDRRSPIIHQQERY